MEKEHSDNFVENHKGSESDHSDATGDGFLLAADRRASAERSLLRKLDRRLLPTVVLVYIMNYIDRTSLTSARLKGLQQDLNITDVQYSVILAVLFAAYCPTQIPSNMLINYITRPSIYIATCVVLWGLTSLLGGVTKNFAGILACRIFIGFPEAAFYPGSIYLLSRWYTRKELTLRSAILYAASIASNAFGSLMAAGILSGMEGKLGVRAWRWLFFIEGAITIFIGLQALWLLPDHPHNTRWLTAAERRLARVRLAEDAGEVDEDSSEDTPWQGLKLALQDPKVYVLGMMGFTQLLGTGFINFFPTLTATLGFSTTITLLLAVPPWALTAIAVLFNARHADKTGERFFHLAAWWWFGILGYIIAQATPSVGGRYVSLFLMAIAEVSYAITLVWVSNSVPRPPSKRAAALGLVNGFGNLGNLVSSFVWRAQWSPNYTPSMIIGIVSLALATCFAFWVRVILIQENRRLDQDEQGALKGARREHIEQAARLEGITIEEAMARKRGFRYLY